MKCPHCLENFHDNWHPTALLRPGNAWLGDRDGGWYGVSAVCPACNRAIIKLRLTTRTDTLINETMVYPKGVARSPLPPEVTDPYASDYREACNVFTDSPKASAALGRRCLQSVLRDKAGVKKGNLHDEIEEVVTSKTLPSDLADALHHVRVIGNFAAHPEKSVNTGAVVAVEPGEAEWTLDVRESLFDFYFVRPAKLAARKAEINKKLADAGKKPLT